MKEIEADLLIDAMATLHEGTKINFEKKERERKKQYIKDHFPLKELKKAGMLTNITDFDYIEKRLCAFFGFSQIYEYSHFGKIVPNNDGTIANYKTIPFEE